MKLRLPEIVGALLCTILLTSCSQRGYTPTFEELHDSDALEQRLAQDRKLFFQSEAEGQKQLKEVVKQRLLAGIGMGNYLLGPGDEVSIISKDPEELNVDFRVPEDGHAQLPIVGQVYVNGLTKSELTELLHSLLARYIRKPSIRVRVKRFSSQRVTVIGSVIKPGEVTLDMGTNTLLRVLGKAGGLNAQASNFIHFIPQEFAEQQLAPDYADFVFGMEGQASAYPTSIELQLSQIYGTDGQPPLQIPTVGGDVIIVPQAGKVLVDGEVEKRGAFALGSRMTLLGALAAAGGITYSARVDAVEIVRQVSPAKKAHLIVDLDDVLEGSERDIPLRAGDVVRVPTHMGRQVARDTYDAISKMIQIGIGGTVDLLAPGGQGQ